MSATPPSIKLVPTACDGCCGRTIGVNLLNPHAAGGMRLKPASPHGDGQYGGVWRWGVCMCAYCAQRGAFAPAG